ncbi:hypothetical protein CG724_33225 [Streptomyces sp. CB02120-2]|nr:hypothetical protein CG724_33225 [Streptomyces sp. CB02120-2]
MLGLLRVDAGADVVADVAELFRQGVGPIAVPAARVDPFDELGGGRVDDGGQAFVVGDGVKADGTGARDDHDAVVADDGGQGLGAGAPGACGPNRAVPQRLQAGGLDGVDQDVGHEGPLRAVGAGRLGGPGAAG